MKTTLRNEYRAIRNQVTPEQATAAGNRCLFHLGRLISDATVFIYAPLKGEVNTKPIYDFYSGSTEIGFPAIQGDEMDFFQLAAWTELKSGRLSQEPPRTKSMPAEKGVILVPGLVFSKTGARIGMGKGYYDKFLAKHPKLLRIGLAYDFQISQKEWPQEDFDQAMDFVVCPSAVWGSARKTKIGIGPIIG